MLIELCLVLVVQDSGESLESMPETVPVEVQASSLFDRLRFDAAGRLRAASDLDRPGAEDRHRGRMRLRIGAHYDLDDNITAHARLSTASSDDDPNNPNWDFGDGGQGFAGGDLVLDRFYVDWVVSEQLKVQAGKFRHAYSTLPVGGEFLWDADVQPAGLAATWSRGGGADAESHQLDWDLRVAEYVAVETGSDNEVTMFGVQGNLYADLAQDSQLQLAASYSRWANLDEGVGTFVNQGNTDVAGDFAILDAFALYKSKGGALGHSQLFAEYLYNLEDDEGEDTGYTLGGVFGPTGSEGDLSFFGSWYDLDANAVFSPVSQNDTPVFGTGTGTGMSGFIAGGQYFVSEVMRIRLWGLTSDTGASKDAYRIRLDFDFTIR